MLRLKLALLSTVCLVPYAIAPALAANAGVTAAVNQSAHATAPGGAVRTIVLGENIVQDEEIKTDGKGLVQILLADGTTFTVGPNSALTIDKFVYNPDAGTAQVSASLTRGVFRFIGGRTSKTPGGVTLNTPVGTVGIRGAVADINLAPGGQGIVAQIDLLFGEEVTLTPSGGGSERIYQPGYSIIVGGGDSTKVTKTPPGSTNQIQQALAGQPGTSGGSPNKPSDQTVVTSGVPGTNSNHDITDNTPIAPGFTLPQPDGAALGSAAVANAVEDAFHLLVEEETSVPPTGPGLPDPPISGHFRGFSAGIAVGHEQFGGSFGPEVLWSENPDTEVDFDAASGTLGGTINLKGENGAALQELVLPFGDENANGTSTFTDNTHYSASGAAEFLEATLQGVTAQGVRGTGNVHLSSNDGLPRQDFHLCACDFLQWGTWIATFAAPNGQVASSGTSETASTLPPASKASPKATAYRSL